MKLHNQFNQIDLRNAGVYPAEGGNYGVENHLSRQELFTLQALARPLVLNGFSAAFNELSK